MLFAINRSCSCNLNKYLKFIKNRKSFGTLAHKRKQEDGDVIISCLRKTYNLYSNQINKTGKLEEIPLASKGWTNNKSRGDHFTIHANYDEFDKPCIPFQDLLLHKNLIKSLSEQGISHATQFQNEAIPKVMSGKHTLLAAETGCGKTLAYLLPILEKLTGTTNDELNTPRALIMVPNRELAHQIGTVASSLCENIGLKVKVIVGGQTKKLMMHPNFSDVDILIGTPGVIGKLSTVGIFKLNKVCHTVFDEADNLLDDSFESRMNSLLKRVSQSQIIFTSATLPQTVPEIFEPIMTQAVQVKSQRLHKPLLNVKQKFLRLSKSTKPYELLEIAKHTKDPLLVFTNRNETCNWLAMFLRENDLKCANINGDMNYHIRIEQWEQFTRGFVNILSATDVGSRGLDTTQVKHVLNYDFPLYAADYIHRVGRIGRLGSPLDGKITNFISGFREIKLVQEIELAVRTNNEITNVDGNIKRIIENKISKAL